MDFDCTSDDNIAEKFVGTTDTQESYNIIFCTTVIVSFLPLMIIHYYDGRNEWIDSDMEPSWCYDKTHVRTFFLFLIIFFFIINENQICVILAKHPNQRIPWVHPSHSSTHSKEWRYDPPLPPRRNPTSLHNKNSRFYESTRFRQKGCLHFFINGLANVRHFTNKTILGLFVSWCRIPIRAQYE